MHPLRSKAVPLLIMLAFLSAALPVRAAQMPLDQLTAPSSSRLILTYCRFSVGSGVMMRYVDAKCGVLHVPENPALPAGRKIDLQIYVLPALNPDTKGLPIFHLEGGPGASAIQGFGRVWYDAYAEIRKTHPIVLIDQRGTGHSQPLNCIEISSQTVSDLSKVLSPKEDQANELIRLQDCYKRLSVTADLHFYTSIELADDTDAVRDALGYDQIELFGNSYGTSLAQIYLKRHGDHVAGAVLDSVTGPWNYPFLDAPNDGQASLTKVFALCAADASCNKKYPQLDAQLKKVLASLTANPITQTATNSQTKQPRVVLITAGRIESVLFELLYNMTGITEIPLLISQMAAGNYTTIARSLAQASDSDPIALGLYMSVTCAENAAFYTDAVLKTHRQVSVFSGTDLKALCKVWPSAALTAADVAPVRSNRPVLILSGGFDPITPVRFGTETHTRFLHSSLVVFPNQGHGIIPVSKCAQTIVETFFSSPNQAVNSICAVKDLKPLFVGAYSVELIPFRSDSASFVGEIPRGWKTEQDDAITFMSSPDGLQFAGAGIYRFQKPDLVKDALLAQIEKRFGTVEIKEQQTISLLFTSQVTLAFTLNRPDQLYYGLIVLQARGDNTYAIWQAAPFNWFSASVAAITPGMFTAMHEAN